MASYYIDIMKSVQPEGPYNLLGLCFSGMVVFEMALQLQQVNEKVNFLGMVNNYAPPENPTLYRIKTGLDKFLKMEFGEQFHYAIDKNISMGKKLLSKARILESKIPEIEEIQIDEPVSEVGNDLRTIHSVALLNYHPVLTYKGNIFIFRTSEPIEKYFNDQMGWDRLVSGTIETTIIPGSDNDTIITDEPYNVILSQQVKAYLDKFS
jgi:thioesterase domain-containing protein